MFITLQDAIVQSVTLDAPSTGVPSSGMFAVWRFLEVFPISTQRY